MTTTNMSTTTSKFTNENATARHWARLHTAEPGSHSTSYFS